MKAEDIVEMARTYLAQIRDIAVREEAAGLIADAVRGAWR